MSLEAEVRSLQQVPMFRDVEAAKLKLLAFASERVSYRDREALFHVGDDSDAVYVVLEGAAVVALDTPAGPLEVARLGRNALVGEMGVILDQPRSAHVTAAGEVVALRIRRDVFFDALREFPKIAVAVMRDLALRLENTNAQLAARAGPGGG